ncbi:1-acyl-sn-glycerol-3-phosphate acyltransferase [bacterium]|nr:1-acyl-sn-glycerol-3-phosphate acyltransferase [bacterium]MBU1651838.1 1-acyl-sn-glycerol-3-phosphate acyltransferase [bacterium]
MKVPKYNLFILYLTWYTFKVFCWIYFRASGKGYKNYPKKGPYLIAMNHNSLIDIPAMATAVNRPGYTMVKASLFKIPVVGWWMRRIGFFPVKRGAGDRQAIENSRGILARGDVLILAPEGTRHRKGESRPKVHSGIVRLAQEFDCPIIPVGVTGTRKILPPGAKVPRPFKLLVRIGEPIHLEKVEVTPKNQEILQRQAEMVMDKVYELSGDQFE